MLFWVDHRAAPGVPLAGTMSGHRAVHTSLALLLAMAFVLIACPPSGAQMPSVSPEPIVVASPVDPRVPPALALNASGRPRLIWQEPGSTPDSARLMWSIRPFSVTTTLADVPISPDSGLTSRMWHAPRISSADPFSVAWSNGVAADSIVFSRTGDAEPTFWEPGQALAWIYGLDSRGGLFVAWWSGESLVVEQPLQGGVFSYAVPPDRVVTDLKLAFGDGAPGYLAWSMGDLSGEEAGIWYAPLSADGSPTQMATTGLLKAAAVDRDGFLHLAWVDSDGLWHARIAEAGVAQLVRGGVATEAPVALGTGPGGIAHLVWVENGALRQARSSDWSLSLTQLPSADVLSAAITVDSRNHAHIAWIEQPAAQEARLLMLEPLDVPPMIAVVWPAPGDLVSSDGWVQAETNGVPDAWESVTFYLQPSDEPGGQAPLRELGVDTDGADGWRVELGRQVFREQVRAVAIGLDRTGRIARATGEPFTVLPEDQPVVWIQPVPVDEAAGELRVGIPPDARWSSADSADLYLVPTDLVPLPSGSGSGSSEMVYAGHASLSHEAGASTLTLDTRTVPDGTYRVALAGESGDGQALLAASAATVTVDNVRAPHISALRWKDSITQGRFGLVAELDNSHRAPTQIDFFVQPTQAPTGGPGPGIQGELLWVGRDVDPEDGWSAEGTLKPSWRDKAFVGWAVACDDRELCGTGASEARVLTENDSPLLWLAHPSAGDTVSGTVPIGLYGEGALYGITRVEGYAEGADGSLSPLGDLAWDGRGWRLEWDTRLLQDGAYRLLVEARQGSLGRLSYWSDAFQVANRMGGRDLRVWPDESPVSGEVRVSLEGAITSASLQSVDYYLVDAGGKATPVASGLGEDVGWAALVNTHEVVNGAYTFVAAIRSEDGILDHIETPVEVRNGGLRVGFLRGPGEVPVAGRDSVTWHTLSGGQGLSLGLDYSPDGGQTWTRLASDLAPSGSLQWNSETVPDSDQAFLRLVARDAQCTTSTIRGPFVVDNDNEPPALTLLWPQPGEVLAGVSPVRWATRDPDGDAVQVELLARQGESPWVPLAGGLDATGEYAWQTGDHTAGEGYALRAIARDSRDSITIDTVQDLTIVHNLPPEVGLIWPRQDATLYSRTAILWRASDPDGDRLSIDLYYSDNDGLTWYPLAQDVDDVGYYVWEVSFLPPGATYRLMVVASDAYHASHDQSEGVITIQAETLPGVVLLEPWAGSSVRGLARVVWQLGYPTNGQTYTDLLIRAAGDTGWRPLATGLRDVTSYLWDTTRHADGNYDLALRLRRGSERSVSNVMTQVQVTNDAPEPELVVDAPACGDLLSGWHVVRWSLPGGQNSGSALLEVSSDAGATWMPLATVAANDGRYLWDTDSWPVGVGYYLRATAPGTDGHLLTASTGPFALGGRGLWPPSIEAGVLTDTNGADIRIAWSADDNDGDSLALSLALCSAAGTHCSPLPRAFSPSGEYVLSERREETGTALARVLAGDGRYRVEARVLWDASEDQDQGLELVLLAPTGERTLSGGVPITWEAASSDGGAIAIDIGYSADGGQTWIEIIEDLENVGRYLWQTTLVGNGTYRVRVTARSGERVVSRQSQPFVLETPGRNAPRASLVAAAGSLVQTGSRALAWQASDRDPGNTLARVEYSLGATGPWSVLADELRAPGPAGWSASALPNAPVWLRLVAYDGTLESATRPVGPVMIQHSGTPRVRLIAPGGGECWTGVRALAWAATGGGGSLSVTLERSLDAGRTWEVVASGLPAVGSHLWDSSSVAAGSQVLFRAIARSGDALGLAQLTEPVTIMDATGSQSAEGSPP